MYAENATVEAAFVERVHAMTDLLYINTRRIQTQTAKSNHDVLLWWSDYMRYHEAQTKRPHERVYLVASDLRLAFQSNLYSGPNKWEARPSRQRSGLFLKDKDIKTLHEKHWAIEINGRYYELNRDDRGSNFSSAIRVGDCDRHIAARIFMGTTHCKHRALKDIGKAVIATQTKYELTRDNCHRFVRVFSALALCPNHSAHTLPALPFDVEEYVATRDLSPRSGYGGNPAGTYFGISWLSYGEDDRHRASRLWGEGAEWLIQKSDFGIELSLTIRGLKQKTERKDEKTIYLNQFYVHQEETLYMARYASTYVPRCQTLYRSPCSNLARLDKITNYSIVPTTDDKDYKVEVKSGAYGMIKGPYGVNSINGDVECLRPMELIKDKSGIWRNGDGARLEQPKSSTSRFWMGIEDLFGGASRESFRYHLPTWQLVELAGKKAPLLGYPVALLIKEPVVLMTIAGIAASAVSRRIQNSRDRSPRRLRSRSLVR